MQNRVPQPRPVPDFTPVPRKHRYDGWTAERQRGFIAALAQTGSVRSAARQVNMSPEGAYYLRRAPGAEEFRAAWDAALHHGVQTLVDIAIDRAKEGVPVPVFWKGEQIGERRWYNDRLLMFILRHHLPERYGALAPLPEGTKHPDTLAREAAAAAQADDADWLADQARALAALAWHHRHAVRDAVLALLAGDQRTAADHESRARAIEQVIDRRPGDWVAEANRRESPADAAQDPAHAAQERRHCRPLAESLAATDTHADEAAAHAPRLADLPRHADGSLIPSLPLPRAIRLGQAIFGGPTARDRDAARHACERRIRAAQAEWLAASNEEDWARWLGGER